MIRPRDARSGVRDLLPARRRGRCRRPSDDDDRTPAPVGSTLRDDDRAPTSVGLTLRDDDRAVSTALGYVLSLAIASILISGLMIAGGGFVESEREQVIRSELEVVGQTLIADIEGADRLASAIDGDVTVSSNHPRRVGSSSYTIEIDPTPNVRVYEVTLTAASVDVLVEFRLVTNQPLATGSVGGGDLVVEYDAGAGELVVRER
jgi:hypothetical protein